MKTREDVINKAASICIDFGLSAAFDTACTYNPSKNLPYHNWYHTCSVVVNCYEGASYHNLPYDAIRDLLIAAMFHDHGHSGGRFSDTDNVLHAIKMFHEFYPGPSKAKIEKFIRCTEYPFIHEPFCIEQKILRDADLMQCLMPDWEEMILVGLKKEVEVKKGPISDIDWIKGQIEFLMNAKMYSAWGNAVFTEKVRYGDGVINQWKNKLLLAELSAAKE